MCVCVCVCNIRMIFNTVEYYLDFPINFISSRRMNQINKNYWYIIDILYSVFSREFHRNSISLLVPWRTI